MVSDESGVSMCGCLLRLFWGMVGPLLAVVVGILLMVDRKPVGSVYDFVYAGVLVLLVLARLMDRATPASPESGDLGSISPRQYAATILLGGAIFYTLAHFVVPVIF